ncbi:MAG TPA: hypothetical protein VJT71_12005 [Pyrinomonadaceae bacterium]|nr:hypothetical protein [Pyrinomonadaceae bacterium]
MAGLLGNYPRSGAIIVVASYVILAVLLYITLRDSADRWISALSAIALMLIWPIPLLAGFDRHFYFGYIPGSVYHNPTILLLKPLTIVLFVFSTRFFMAPFRSSINTIVILMAVVVLSAMAKPSYLICLLPALALVASYRLVRKRPVDWRALVIGVTLPAAAMLAWQYLQTYATGHGSIAFAPFLVARHFSEWLLPKFFLSIAFPLAVTALFFSRVVSDVRMRLAWLGAIIGLFCFYFLIEAGPGVNTFHGNFGWSGVITLFVLFFASTVFLLEQWKVHRLEETPKWPLVLSTVILGLHVISGVVWHALGWNARQYW